jgi:hypothetical protein
VLLYPRKEANDLLVVGQEKLGTIQRLTAWKKHLAKKVFISDVNIDGDEEAKGDAMEDDLCPTRIMIECMCRSDGTTVN